MSMLKLGKNPEREREKERKKKTNFIKCKILHSGMENKINYNTTYDWKELQKEILSLFLSLSLIIYPLKLQPSNG